MADCAAGFLRSGDGWGILKGKKELGKERMEDNILPRWKLTD